MGGKDIFTKDYMEDREVFARQNSRKGAKNFLCFELNIIILKKGEFHMAIGDRIQNHFFTYKDPHTGTQVTRLTSPDHVSRSEERRVGKECM